MTITPEDFAEAVAEVLDLAVPGEAKVVVEDSGNPEVSQFFVQLEAYSLMSLEFGLETATFAEEPAEEVAAGAIVTATEVIRQVAQAGIQQLAPYVALSAAELRDRVLAAAAEREAGDGPTEVDSVAVLTDLSDEATQ